MIIIANINLNAIRMLIKCGISRQPSPLTSLGKNSAKNCHAVATAHTVFLSLDELNSEDTETKQYQPKY